MDNKTFKVGFYQENHGDQDIEETIGDYLREWATKGHSPPRKVYTTNYEIRNLMVTPNGRFIRGEFAKFRDDDLPHIGQIGGDERQIELADEEGLIEKNYFLYYKKYRLFVYQQNGNASTSNQFGRYFTDVTGETTTLDPVLQPEAMRRLLQSEVKPKMLEVSYARPTNPNIVANDVWTDDAFKILAHAGGANAYVRVSLGHEGGFLKQGVKKSIRTLMNNTDVRVARVKVDDDGVEHTIDLIADRIKATITVPMIGRYPDPDHIFQELGSAYREQEKAIKAVLGGENGLV